MSYDNRDRRDDRRDPEPRCEIVDPHAYRLPEKPIEDPKDANLALNDALRLGFNVLAPLTGIQHVPANYRVAIRIVSFSMDGPWIEVVDGRVNSTPDPTGKKCSNGTWYKTDGGKFALHKAPLMMLASVAGVRDIRTQRVEPIVPNYWNYRAELQIRTLDAQWATREGSKEIDLTDDSPAIKGWTQQRLQNARANGAANAETKAILRALRSAFGLESTTEDKARKPYVIPVLVYEAPDDPAVRLLQAATEMGVIRQVFGEGRADRLLAPMAPPAQLPEDLPRDEGKEPAREREREPRERERDDRDRERTPPRDERKREEPRRDDRDERGRRPDPRDDDWDPETR